MIELLPKLLSGFLSVMEPLPALLTLWFLLLVALVVSVSMIQVVGIALIEAFHWLQNRRRRRRDMRTEVLSAAAHHNRTGVTR